MSRGRDGWGLVYVDGHVEVVGINVLGLDPCCEVILALGFASFVDVDVDSEVVGVVVGDPGVCAEGLGFFWEALEDLVGFVEFVYRVEGFGGEVGLALVVVGVLAFLVCG